MSKKIILSTFLLFVVVFSFSQEKINEFKNSLKSNVSDIKDVISIVNKKNGDLAYFIADAKNVYGYKLNSNFKVTDKLSSSEKRRKYKILIGYSISDNGNYTAYLTNKNKNKFLAVTFSFADNKTNSKEFKLDLNEERFIQTASLDNKFYLISVKKSVNGFYVYEFTNNGEFKRLRIDTTNLKFINKYGKNVTVPYLLTYARKDINKVDENIPNAIEVVADNEKMYLKNNNVVFTFDSNKNFMQLLSINLKTFKATSKVFPKSLESVKRNKKKTNSYINGNDVFLLASTKKELVLDILDFNSKEKKKTLSILRDKPISFKNTPIIQEGGFYDGYRELEKTKKFLRKINASKIGLSARKNSEGNYHLIIGGYTMQQNSGAMMGGMIGGMMGGFAVGTIGNATVFFNPAQFAYSTMANSKSTRIECLFNTSFEHLKGEIKDNAFDKMKENDPKSEIGLTVLKYKDYFIRGFYNKNTKTYILEKFID